MLALTIIGYLVSPVIAQKSVGNLFYFHDTSILYRNDNSSLTVIAEANLEPPNNSIAKTIEIAANIRNATTPFGTIWVGSVSWVSQPVSKPQVLDGSITVTAWFSSNDSPPPFSGIGAGITIIDSQGNLVGQPVYAYSYGQGSVLTNQPSSYQFNLNINRSVQHGQRFVFAVGLGATAQGWKMTVYFDSLQYPSRASMPGNIQVAVSELDAPLIAALSLVAGEVLIVTSRRKRQ